MLRLQGGNSVMAEQATLGEQTALKGLVREFWNRASCGEIYAAGNDQYERFGTQARARYELEPYIPAFARFADGAGRDVLEIGVGMGWELTMPNGPDTSRAAWPASI